MTDSGAAAPLRISWSQIRVHEECPAKGPLQRANKSPYTDIRNFVHGNITDLAMRRWLAMDPPPPGWMAAHIDDIFDESLKIARESGDGIVKWKHRNDQDETRELCRELVTRLEPILARYCLPFEWDPALRFSVPIMIPYLDGSMRQILLVGEMDLLVRDAAGNFVVWDLKATKDNAYYKKVLGQLAFYALAVRAMHGRFPVKTGLIQPMCDQRVLPVDVTDQAVREMAGRITKTAQDKWAGNLAPKASNEGCGWCDVHNQCSKFARKTGRQNVTIGRA